VRSPVSLQFPNLEGASDVIEAARAQASYQDTHRWKFTPGSFELLMLDLARLGYHKLGQVSSYPTEGFEFFVTLGNDVSLPDTDRLAALLRIEDELSVVLRRQMTTMLRADVAGRGGVLEAARTISTTSRRAASLRQRSAAISGNLDDLGRARAPSHPHS
jgi:hypothetical protein